MNSRLYAPLAATGLLLLASIAMVVLSIGGLLAIAPAVLALGVLTLAALTTRRHLAEELERLVTHVAATSDPDSAGEESVEDLLARDDAVGMLARAFEEKRAEGLRLAAANEQLGRALATTITDATRRSLVLVHRLLDRLDTLQREESDPTRLERLYELDHLTVRLRRQNENLLVVADDTQGGDPDEAPMRVLDMVRLAASETEGYRRVRVDADARFQVVGWASRPLAQMVAALLDNALRYSPPESSVVVAARQVEAGVHLTIRDHGIGMGEEDLAAANRTLVSPPLLHAAQSRQLGLYVAGVIASRLGIPVQLHRPDDEGAGLVASLVIDQRLLTGEGALPAPPVQPSRTWPASRAEAARQIALQEGLLPTGRPDLPEALPEVSAQPPAGAVAQPTSSGPQAASSAPQPTSSAPQPTSSAPQQTEPKPAPSRRRRRGQPMEWSISMDRSPASPPAGGDPDVAFVASPDAPQMQVPSEPEPPVGPSASVAPHLGARPEFAAPETHPALQASHSAEPDDYVPEVVDNPLLDIPADPNVASLPAIPSAPAHDPVLPEPQVLDGIQVAAEEADHPVQNLPTRDRQDPDVRAAVTQLFADIGSTGDDDGAGALAGLASIDRDS